MAIDVDPDKKCYSLLGYASAQFNKEIYLRAQS